MIQAADSLLRSRLTLPEVGEECTFRKGPLELLLRRQHGGLCLITPNEGAQEKRHYLGLPDGGWLELHTRPPAFRVRIRLVDPITLAPGGRLRGYVRVPLPQRLVWCRADGRQEALLDVVPQELQTSWMGEGADGGYLHETDSEFRLERRALPAETLALVPVFLINHCEHSVSPEHITVSLRERDIRELDRQLVAAPRRLEFGIADQVEERIRPLPRRSA